MCQDKVMNKGREPMNREEINTEKDDKGNNEVFLQNLGSKCSKA